MLCTQSQAEADQLLAQLRAGLFYDGRHRLLYAELLALRAAGHAVDPVVIASWLQGRGKVDQCGGLPYVAGLPDLVPSVMHFGDYLKTLEEKAWRRWCLSRSVALAELARAEDMTPDRIKGELAEVLERTSKLGAAGRPMLQILTVDEVKRFEPDPSLFLVGADMISRGDMAVIAGWPGLGKSRLSTTLAVAGARGRGQWMGYEVKRRFRTLILQAQNSTRRLKGELESLPEALGESIRVSVPTALHFSRPEFRAEVRRYAEAWPFDLLVLDPWNTIAKDEGQADYLEALDNIRASLPEGDSAPAICIVAHLRKQRGGDSWRPKVGRELLNELAGSFALGAEARTVFIVQPASMDMEDDRLVFDCAKSNNDQPHGMSAWHRRNGEFLPCRDFDFDAWLAPAEEDGGRRSIGEDDVARLFAEHGPSLTRQEAVAELKAAGFAQATAYRALSLHGRFAGRLWETQSGRLSWKSD